MKYHSYFFRKLGKMSQNVRLIRINVLIRTNIKLVSKKGAVFSYFTKIQTADSASVKTKMHSTTKIQCSYLLYFWYLLHISQCMRFPTIWYVRPAKPKISLHNLMHWLNIFQRTMENQLRFINTFKNELTTSLKINIFKCMCLFYAVTRAE